ncbi:MAG: penicillin acylase family protein, partial [Deltaproteobacteria bacterium]
MKRLVLVLFIGLSLGVAVYLGCGKEISKKDQSPFSSIPISETHIFDQLTAEVEVIRDTYGIPHIYAHNQEDLAFVLGYVAASDRLLQMDLFRREPLGELSAIIDDSMVDSDINYRIMGFRRQAEMIYNHPEFPEELKTTLDLFSQGINAYISELDKGSIPVEHSLLGLEVEDIRPWTPLDTLAVARYESYHLSFTGNDKKSNWKRKSHFEKAFPGREDDLYGVLQRFAPPTDTTIVPGFHLTEAPASPLLSPPSRLSSGKSIPLDPSIVNKLVSPEKKQGLSLFGGVLSQSNNWVVGGTHTESGYPMLANDPHLSLMAPPIFYELHLNTSLLGEGDLNVIGITFTPWPLVLIGHNERIAWGITTFSPDVTDVYLETITPSAVPGEAGTVLYNDGQVPIQVLWETIEVRDSSPRKFPVLFVPHHGPIFRDSYEYDEGSNTITYNSCTGAPQKCEALSFHWTGEDYSNEAMALYIIDRANNLDKFKEGLSYFEVGAQSFVYADVEGNIYFSGHSSIPKRPAAALNTTTPVYLPLPGEGGYEWEEMLPDVRVPYVENPPEGFIVTANNDPCGLTTDNDLFNDTWKGGDPYYLGYDYCSGFRAQRPTDRIKEVIDGGGKVSFEEMQSIQGDHYSLYAERLLPFILEATGPSSEIPGPSTLKSAVEYLEGWSLDTPAGTDESATQDEINDSVATSVFETWIHFIIDNTFGDEYDAANLGFPWSELDIRALIYILELEPPDKDYYFSVVNCTGTRDEEGICTGYDSPTTKTRAEVISESLDQAIAYLQGEHGYNTDDMSQWRWGKLHTVTFEHPALPMFNIPPEGGFARGGTNFTVDPGFHDDRPPNQEGKIDFSYGGGPQMRMVVELQPGAIRGENVIPGGDSGNPPLPAIQRESPHYDDQAQLWVDNKTHPMWFYTEEVI